MTATLDVIDSYLSLDATQYAQAPIGATRIATKGDGVDLRGTVPKWTAPTSWEVEFDIVFPTTLIADKVILDCDADGLNRVAFTISASNSWMDWLPTTATVTMGGAAVTRVATPYPIDGAVRHIKMTGTGIGSIGTILARHSSAKFSTATLFNLRLTDVTTPANSRFYPMDETIATATFLDASANAQNGTWVNRVSGDVITVYPGAIKPAVAFTLAAKFRIPTVVESKFLLSVGSYVTGGSSVVLRLDASSNLLCTRYNGTTAINTATYSTPLTDGTEYFVVVKIGTDGAISLYVNSLASLVTAAAGTAFAVILDWLNINGAKSTVGVSVTRGAIDDYYSYLYTGALADADITALMAGENPENVGTILQGYSLVGDGDEYGGGPALTLYNGGTWYVPPSNNSSLIGNLLGSLISNLIT